MSEFIGRLSAIWLWKESTPWTQVSASVWMPKTGWVLAPEFEKATDDSWYWVIDEIYDMQTTKNVTTADITWILRDDWTWYLFLWTLWTYESVQWFTWTPSWWTPARWDYVYVWSVWSETWIWYIRKILVQNSTTIYYVSTTSWTLANWDTVTNWTFTIPSIDLSSYTNVKWHFFSRKNDNAHQTFTLYQDDSVWAQYSTYAMVNTFWIESAVWEFVTFSVNFRWKKLATATAQSPSYTNDNPFLAKNANVYFASDESWLNVATAQCMQNFTFEVNKNLTEIQCFGSDDVDSIHNQQFWVTWDLEAIYNSVTLRDYVVNSEKKALRLELINTSATALVTWIYPSIYVDFMRVSFEDWSPSDDNNSLVNQTMWFTWEFSVDDSATMEILLLNSNATGY